MVVDNNNTHFDMGTLDANFLLNNLNDHSSNTSTVLNNVDDWLNDFPPNLLSLDGGLLAMSIEEHNPSLSWSYTPSNKNYSDTVSKSGDGSPRGKSLFDNDDEVDSIDLYAWTDKTVEEWDEVDTKNWLLRAAGKLGHSYGRFSPKFIIPGKELLHLTRADFIAIDPNIGEKLFNLFRKESEEINSPSGAEFSSDDEASGESDNGASDRSDCDSGLGRGKKRVGRPQTRKLKEPRLKLWEFVRNLLLDPNYCPRWICWEDYNEKTFRFIKSSNVAKLWGERDPHKNKMKEMTFENFSRAMRYYYKKNIFEQVPGRRLVYKFGKNATGLETNCPNFDPNYYNNLPKSEV